MTIKTEVLVKGLGFPEGPRWHEGRLWFSDMSMSRVMAVDLNGRLEKIVDVPGQPSGLGWLPDGRLLMVSMTNRRLMRLDSDGLSEVVDLSRLAAFHCNDMVVDTLGRAYIGNFGFVFGSGAPFVPAAIIMVPPEGDARIVAENMIFPNGTVISPDGRTLIVAETFGSRLSAFDIEPDGSLNNHRVWAKLESVTPDGICLDAKGAVWAASPFTSEVLRICEGAKITQRLKLKTPPYACMLGGEDRKILFLMTAGGTTQNSGQIEFIRVDVPGAGLP